MKEPSQKTPVTSTPQECPTIESHGIDGRNQVYLSKLQGGYEHSNQATGEYANLPAVFSRGMGREWQNGNARAPDPAVFQRVNGR